MRRNAAVAFVIHGKAKPVSELLGIPLHTVYSWIKSEWWPDYINQAKREHQELIESRMSDIVEKATAALIDRIENGEIIYVKTKKGIALERVPVRARELDNIITHLSDKLRLIRNQPTRLVATAVFDPHQIAKKMAAIAVEVRKDVVIDG